MLLSYANKVATFIDNVSVDYAEIIISTVIFYHAEWTRWTWSQNDGVQMSSNKYRNKHNMLGWREESNRVTDLTATPRFHEEPSVSWEPLSSALLTDSWPSWEPHYQKPEQNWDGRRKYKSRNNLHSQRQSGNWRSVASDRLKYVI